MGGRTIAMVAQGMPWSSNGSAVIVTVVGQRRHNYGTSEAEASLKLIHNVNNNNVAHFFTGRPMAEPCASILQPR